MALNRGLSKEMLVVLVREAGSKGALGASLARFLDFVVVGSFGTRGFFGLRVEVAAVRGLLAA